MSRPFILVHGAWHGGWVWQRSARLLRSEGHDVFTPSLTGLGDRAHLLSPDISLTTHVRDITMLIESYELSDVTLCGHSYAGLVVGQVADQMPDRIAKLVLLDAFVPIDGMSVLDLSSGHAVREGIETAVREYGNGEYGNGEYVPAPPAAQFQLRDQADSDWVDRHLGAQPFRTFTEKTSLTGAWRDADSLVYVAGTGSENPMTELWDAARADERIEFREIECGHNIMVDRPEDLHAILVE
ncbi:esterase [Novosphingobium marinum]|uniref:Pimeloyl-ACP methyl ester carboxylesterase n=1 Tax=Novosphingobium marinum TaxID=1514948 RepID=A0A7Y9XYL8_9SPHN|nr:alpha/beta hydrolase [Novosphingobium marinum]NYH97034.1 pimeloyl-ACP methyl ester carboxylesterase [Novosphingobium marinum]GGC43050.1 esterase [Novosphingobium marinum]